MTNPSTKTRAIIIFESWNVDHFLGCNLMYFPFDTAIDRTKMLEKNQNKLILKHCCWNWNEDEYILSGVWEIWPWKKVGENFWWVIGGLDLCAPTVCDFDFSMRFAFKLFRYFWRNREERRLILEFIYFWECKVIMLKCLFLRPHNAFN